MPWVLAVVVLVLVLVPVRVHVVVSDLHKNLLSLQGLCQPAIKTSHLLQLFEDVLPGKKIPIA